MLRLSQTNLKEACSCFEKKKKNHTVPCEVKTGIPKEPSKINLYG